MKNGSEIYGAARRGGRLLAARVENDGARRLVRSLEVLSDGDNGDRMAGGRLFFAVDSRLVVIKKVWVRESSFIEATAIAQFEASQCLLEPPEKFYFDLFPLHGRNGHQQFLAIAYHRRPVDDQIEIYGNTLRKPSGFKLDAVALADGYRTFCRADPGDLQLLADIESDTVTMAVLYQGKLHAVARMETTLEDTVSLETAKRLAAEFKMVWGLQSSELFRDGITVPLSRVILAGRYAREEFLRAALEEQMATEVMPPHFHEGYFQLPEAPEDRLVLEQFLIPLGLAAE